MVAHLMLRSGGVDAGVLNDVFEARGLMLRDLAELAARRGAPAERLAELAAAIAAAPDDASAQQLDFAYFTELAQQTGNLVFVLIMNSIRALYFEHAALLPVTARHEELAPLYARAAQAIAAGDERRARRAVGELADRQRERVEAALRA
jgi:DNA-binding FadR family transcriptional regulator